MVSEGLQISPHLMYLFWAQEL